MKIKKAITLVVLLQTTMTFCQNQISGKITDVSSNPLPYTNVVLHSSINKVVAGTISDDGGSYRFEKVPNGKYWIEVSVLGFKTQKNKLFTLLENKNKTVNFVMEEESEILGEVVIKSSKPVIRQTAEKLIVDLENSTMVTTNLQGVMKKVPGVIVANGKLSYAGQQGIRIFINGKTTNYMDTSSLLRDFPADNIAKVELIQQPGAEFDADGSGPIINIILKKNVQIGTHGNTKLYSGYDNTPEYGVSASLSSYKGKVNWHLSSGYKKTGWRDDLFLTRRVRGGIYSQSTTSPYDPVNFRINGSIDYHLSPKNSIGLSIRRRHTDSDRITSNRTRVQTDSIAGVLFTDNVFDRKQTVLTVNPYYEYSDDVDRLVVDLDYVNYHNGNTSTLHKLGASEVPFKDQRYIQDGKYKILTYKADYKRIVNDGFNWMLGGKYMDVDTDSYLESQPRNKNGVFEKKEEESNSFLVEEDILALYSKTSIVYNKWNFTAGLRWERSITKGTSTNSNTTRSREISRIFPSASLGRKINEKLGINVAYSNRIQRRDYSSLNSFVFFYDPYTYSQGNAALRPSFTDNFQFSFTYLEKPFFSVGYRETSDVLFELVSQNDDTAQTYGVTVNLAKNKNWNFRAFAPLNFLRGLDGYSGFIVNYNSYESVMLMPKLSLSLWSLTWYTNIEYELPWEMNAELSGYYTSGGLQGQIVHDWLAGMSFAISKSFMKGKLKVNGGVEELLNREFVGRIDYGNIDTDVRSDWSRQNVYLQLTYNFGSKYSKEKKRANVSKEIQERLGNNN